MDQNRKVHWIQVWWWGRLNFFAPEMRKMILATFLSFVGRVWWRTVLFECERLMLEVFLASAREGVKIVSMYELVLTIAPCGTKMRGDFHVLETAAHTKTEDGFWRLKNLLHGGRNVNRLSIRLFCRLNIASTLNTFSSEKMISPVFVPDFILFRRTFARASLLSFWRFVRWWQVCSMMGETFRLALTIFLIVFSLTFISRAIFFIELLRLHRTLARTSLMTFGVREVLGLPLRRRPSVLFSSLNILTVW